MAKKKQKKKEGSVLEAGLMQCMHALDSQVAREMQRTPAQREEQGVQKWEPYAKRIESVAGCILDAIGREKITLDSLLILSQASSKALSLAVDDLGEEGLGAVRSQYAIAAAESILYDSSRILAVLKGTAEEALN